MHFKLKQTEPLSRPTNPWLILIAVGLGAFMAVLDTSIVNVTLPTMQEQLHTNLTTVSWTLHLYNLVFAAFLITAGRLGDIYGRKRFMLIGLLLFATGSLICGMSPSIWCLLGARALQATGAAILSAVSMALVHAAFPKEQRSLAMTVFGSLNALGGALGPIIGGILLPAFGWRSIFFVNVPFCLVGFLLVSRFVPEMRGISEKKRIDVLGLIMISLALFCLVLAIIEGSDWGWMSPGILSLFGWAATSLGFFIFVELRHPEPILDIRLFRRPGFGLSNIATFLYCVALQGGVLLLSLYFLNARGETQLAAALSILPVSFTSLIVPNLMSLGGRFFTPRLRCLLGVGSTALGLGLFCTLTTHSTYFDIAWREAIFGSGIALCVTSFPIVALADVPPEKLGAASGAINTFRQIGFVLGVAFLVSILSGQLKLDSQTARTSAITIVQTDTRLPVELRDDILSQFFAPSIQLPPGQADLLRMIDGHTSWQASKSELVTLNNQIETTYNNQTVYAYALTWAVAAAFPAVGVGVVIALLLILRTGSRFTKREMDPAWSTFYFFSTSGMITESTIQQYLAIQQMPTEPQLPLYTP